MQDKFSEHCLSHYQLIVVTRRPQVLLHYAREREREREKERERERERERGLAILWLAFDAASNKGVI
jgi:hypothetical protein